MTTRMVRTFVSYLMLSITATPVIMRMTSVISPKGRCRKATEGCRLRLRNIPTKAWICYAFG